MEQEPEIHGGVAGGHVQEYILLSPSWREPIFGDPCCSCAHGEHCKIVNIYGEVYLLISHMIYQLVRTKHITLDDNKHLCDMMHLV